MTSTSDDVALTEAYLSALYAQVGGALNGTAPDARLRAALGWDGAVFDAVGRRLDLAGHVRQQAGYVRLLADGKRLMEGGETWWGALTVRRWWGRRDPTQRPRHDDRDGAGS